MLSFFLKKDDRIVQLPVNPKDLEVTTSMDNKGTEVIQLGEITNIGLENLKALAISSFFPSLPAAYVHTNGDFQLPEFYLEFIQQLKNDREPVRLIVSDTEINMLVTIESFNYKRVWGTDDIEYDLELKEYRTHSIKVLTAVQSAAVVQSTTSSTPVTPVANTSSSRPVEKPAPTTYRVVSGDSLWVIANRLLGSGSRWQEIYNFQNNKNIIGGNPNLIKPGQVLSIPPR